MIGGGGREHALAWKLAQSPGLSKLYAAPGNPGIARHAECVALDVGDHPAVVSFARKRGVGLVVVGPEAPLVAGLADALRAADVPVFGPSAAAARLEGSKGFTKELCAAAGIPTAVFVRARSREEARAALSRFGVPVVVKADGLAAGKGVVVAATAAEAEEAVDRLFAESGAEAVIEEFLEGEEASLFVLADRTSAVPFGSARDHKRVGEGDTGPNTGGMGAYSPAADVLTPELEARAMREIVAPTLAALAARGTPYSGVLYAGLMLTRAGPKLIEYNARFGDPEAQVVLPLFKGDLLELLLAAAEGRLAEAPPPRFARGAALTVVVAARGYPRAPAAGGAIERVEQAEAAGALVFHAGTARGADGALRASGGRVLAVTGLGSDLAEARARAYAAVALIRFADGFHRQDIGGRALAGGEGER